MKLVMLDGTMGWEYQVVNDVAVGIPSLKYTTDPVRIAGAADVLRLMVDELVYDLDRMEVDSCMLSFAWWDQDGMLVVFLHLLVFDICSEGM